LQQSYVNSVLTPVASFDRPEAQATSL